MKIIHYTQSMHIGGISRLVIDLMTEQQNSGISPALLLNYNTGDFLYEVHNLNISVLSTDLQSGTSFNITKIKKCANKVNEFDLIHVHFYNPVVHLLTRYIKIPVVYTMHGLSKPFKNKNVLRKVFFESIKKRFLNSQVNTFVSNSQFTMNEAIRDYNLRKVNKKVVLNGIRFSNNYNTLKPNIDSEIEAKLKGKFVVGFISNFTKQKRIDLLINSISDIVDKGITDIVLLLIGNGSESNNLRNLVFEKKLSEYVVFAGHQSNVFDWYNFIDICSFPARYESFGLVAVEAFSLGKPVLVFSDSGGLLEIVSPFEPDDVVKNQEEMAERILFYKNNPTKIESRKNERINHSKLFSSKRMADEYEEIYKSLLNK